MQSRTQHFFGGLESLRGIAALIVVFHHIGWSNPLTHCNFVRNGYLMVDLFFVLSGFVICHNYASKLGSAKEIAHFMLLRLGRLYPLHLFFLLVFLGIEAAKWFAEMKCGLVPNHSHAFSVNNAPSFLAHLFLVQPFFHFADKTYDAPSWSIGVEFYTYLFFALAILAFGKRRIPLAAGLLALLATFLLCTFSCTGLYVMNGLPGFLRCCFGFFTGVLAYQVYGQYRLVITPWSSKLGWGLLVILGVFLSWSTFGTKWDYLMPPLFGGLIIALAATSGGSLAKTFNAPSLRWLGKVSYSIYLCHEAVVIFMGQMLTLTQKICAKYFSFQANSGCVSVLGFAFVCLTVMMVLIVSHFTYIWIETAGQKWSRKMVEKWLDTKPVGA
jgi:peptidoglycan/LPS O-acetylase OafA/YrhL